MLVWLQQALQQWQIKCEVWKINDGYDYDHIKEQIGTLLMRQDLGNIALNVTSGTKIMYEIVDRSKARISGCDN